MNRSLFVLFILLLFVKSIYADEVRFTASARNVVSVGDRFQATYTLNAHGKDFRGPDFKNFRILSGPNMSTSQNYQIINGKMSQSVTNTFTYYLQAIIEGTFDIPAATIKNNEKTFTSNTLQIKVVKRSSPVSDNSKTGKSPQSSSPIQTSKQTAEDDIFIRAYVNKRNPYQGEQIIVTYNIYTTAPLSQINIDKLSSFPGFWSENLLETDNKLHQYNETYNGREYVVANLRKIALFPQKSGDLTINPMELICIAQIRKEGTRKIRDPFFDSFFDDPFFNSFYQNVEVSLKSNPLKITVNPLPLKDKPVDFSGAVGSYSIKSQIDNLELKTNEAINLKYIISGQGNIQLIDKLNISFPPDFETYDPKITDNIKTTSNGISGKRIFEYLLIPRNAGVFKIKPVNFTYFDLASKSYKMLTTPGYTINVEKGKEMQSGITYSGVSQTDIQYIGSDIRHIKTFPFQINQVNIFILGSLWFYLWLSIPVSLFLVIMIIWRRKIRLRENVALVKNRQATKVARKNLKRAYAYLKVENKNEFFTEISRALWGYLSDKFNIPLAELSVETISDRLLQKKVKDDTITHFTETLNHCEYARFAPGDTSSMMNEIYSEAINFIRKIERELK